MLPTVPSLEGHENFPEAVPVIAEIPLALPSSEERRKLGTTGTTVWFTVEYCQEHLQKALYIVRYLSSSKEFCIVYSGTGDTNGLCAYSDTDWAGDVETSHSTTGYAIFLGNGIVSWLSRQQQRVTLSSTEVKYCGITETAKQLHWICNLYEELGFKLGPLPLCIDNQGTIFLASNPAQEGHMKHVQMMEHFI